MITATISAFDNYFVGYYPHTLGTSTVETLWMSAVLPGVEKILDHKWVYGDYYVASTENVDGTYSMWQSNNVARSWTKRFTTNSKIVVFSLYDLGVVELFTDNNKMYESTNSGGSYTLKSSNAPNVKDFAVTGFIFGNSRDIVTHNGDSISLTQDRGGTFTKTLNLTDTYSQSELLHPTISTYGMDVIASASNDVVQSPYSGDVGTWNTFKSFDSREYVKHLVASPINHTKATTLPSFIAVTDNRPNYNSSVYHSTNAWEWNDTLILSTAPKSKPVGYTIKSNEGIVTTVYAMSIKIPKRTLDQINYHRWLVASHPTSGLAYTSWVNAQPTVSNDPTLVNTLAKSIDFGQSWEIANEHTPLVFSNVW